MITKTTVTIRCDGCGIEQDFDGHNKHESLYKAKWAITTRSFMFDFGIIENHYCPNCKKKLKKK